MKTALDRLEVSLKKRLKDRTLGCSKSFSSMNKYDQADDKRNILDGYDDDLPLAIKSNEERLSVKRLDKFPISIGDIFNEFL